MLRQARLISEKKVGRENRYALHANRLKPVQQWLETLAPAAMSASERKPAGKPTQLSGTKQSAIAASPPGPAVTPAPTQAKPIRDNAASQMGFDF